MVMINGNSENNNMDVAIETKSNIKTICVYCASASGVNPIYMKTAQLLGEKLGKVRK